MTTEVTESGEKAERRREVSAQIAGHERRAMPRRFRDTGQRIYEFGGSFLVRCPRCQRRADVVRLAAPAGEPFRFDQIFEPRRLTCAHCGYSREWHDTGFGIGRDATDWYFELPLWLQTPCCGHVLWAYNEAHLRLLEDYVTADLREGLLEGHGNTSLASRLPRWMKSAKHRPEVAQGLGRLRDLLRD